MKNRNELIRLFKKNNMITIDKTYKGEGRGTYICKNLKCIKQAEKRKILNKYFSLFVNSEEYNKISECAKDEALI
jgi:predicted RNA-binding protein YlxR (DUF448 family)